MNRLIIVSLAALALTGCKVKESGEQGADVALKNASVAEVAKAAQGASAMRPGQWETKVDLVDIAWEGLTPEQKQLALAKAKAEPKSFRYCVSPEEAKRPGAGFLTGESDSSCSYRSFAMAGGRIDSTMVCPGATAKDETVMTVSGTFTEESVDAVTEAKGGMLGMSMKANVASRRIGDCPPA